MKSRTLNTYPMIGYPHSVPPPYELGLRFDTFFIKK
jgi:hypothetical protein